MWFTCTCISSKDTVYVLITLWCTHVQFINWYQKYTVNSKYAYKISTLKVKLVSFPSIPIILQLYYRLSWHITVIIVAYLFDPFNCVLLSSTCNIITSGSLVFFPAYCKMCRGYIIKRNRMCHVCIKLVMQSNNNSQIHVYICAKSLLLCRYWM